MPRFGRGCKRRARRRNRLFRSVHSTRDEETFSSLSGDMIPPPLSARVICWPDRHTASHQSAWDAITVP